MSYWFYVSGEPWLTELVSPLQDSLSLSRLMAGGSGMGCALQLVPHLSQGLLRELCVCFWTHIEVHAVGNRRE